MLTDGISMQTLTVDEFDEPILLNLIDTPGWVADDNGEDAARVCTNLVAFLEEQMDSRVIEELKVRRDKYAPNLIVHACLYFMDPLHNEYRATDIPIIKELGTRVNLIPVVGKSDLITLTQKLQFQLEFINSMKRHADQVSLFDLPGDSVDANESMTGDVPLTMSRDTRTFDKHPDFLGRCYPWGRIDCMDPDQSDFAVLRTMLLESHRDMLRQHTVSSIYEEYRCRQLQSKKRDDLLQRCGSLKLRNAFNSSALELNGHRQV
ncbi:Septin-type guanine nucleotide-binding (G) domain-containing protein [Dimargaris cristalligena]|uniref:Septin-type guanine nucleotide-binding (G) domain-containing protein n=1 Tax=Dimargaris cristalligena TaxID=215637 RepID=A0A4Q0A1H9_9FUNG|nr:Septin-type guanine nucleotide-binding (G) domain-containing protein [Dimargaris cristalligena]|eukprot:RKP39887.1 Septin-type guanine nucleotide-binding (G) domain-containing protein [Dimargaris cristalligena]